MKNFIAFLFMLPSLAFGQQFLWSTADIGKLKGVDINLVSIESVTDRVLDYYDFYEYYYDLSGFSREGLIELLKKDSKMANSIQWKPTTAFNEPTALAFKSNEGKGSIVIVLFAQKDNIDLILFSNTLGPGAIRKDYVDESKFLSWLKSFWDYEIDPTDRRSADYVEHELRSGFVESPVGLENRRFVVPPKIENIGKYSGKVAIEVRVDCDGKVISARAGVRGTTISNNTLYEQCERAVLGTQLNRIDKASPVQTGVIVFNFK